MDTATTAAAAIACLHAADRHASAAELSARLGHAHAVTAHLQRVDTLRDAVRHLAPELDRETNPTPLQILAALAPEPEPAR